MKKAEEIKNRIKTRRLEVRTELKSRFQKNKIKVRKPKKLKHPKWAIKTHRYVQENKKKVAVLSVTGIAIIVGIIVLVSAIISIYPYAISIDGNNICYVRGEQTANAVVKDLVKDYIPEDTELKAVDTDGKLSIVKAETFFVEADKVLAHKKATESVSEYLKEHLKEAVDIKIASSKVVLEKYEPEPNYVKDDTMVAGDEEIEKEGKKGKRYVTKLISSVNGKVISTQDVAYRVYKRGKSATIRRGTIGLPEGEDWKTFKGDPVFKDGDDLAKAGLSHLGARYKYGGYSWTNGIDCVQLVRNLYKQYGIRLPNGHKGIQHSGKGVSLKNAKPGDIVCYKHHMGIYIGDGKMVNAIRKGVSVSKVSSGKVVTIRRVVK